MDEQWSQDKLLALSRGFMKARIVITAAELDLFTKLEQGLGTVQELCEAEGWNPRGLEILLNALTALGLLTKSHDGRYQLERSLTGLLSSENGESVLPMMLHNGRMWQTWSNLTEIVKTGKNPDKVDIRARSDEDMESFIGAMHVVARSTAGKIADSIDLNGFTRLLDAGGGPGTYTMAFLKKAPHLRATLFDLPRVVEMARERLTKEGLMDRVDLVAGDFRTDELPGGHDLVLLSAIIHMNSRAGNRALFEKARRSLDPGGVILIRDYILDETRTHPLAGAIFAVNMLTATEGGNSYTFAEVKEDLERAGFRDIRLIRDGERMDQLIFAVK
jgi:predicted O-methyltransferase YrrM